MLSIENYFKPKNNKCKGPGTGVCLGMFQKPLTTALILKGLLDYCEDLGFYLEMKRREIAGF